MEDYIRRWYAFWCPHDVDTAEEFYDDFLQYYKKTTEIDASIVPYVHMCEFVVYNERFIFDPSVPHKFCSLLIMLIDGAMANLANYSIDYPDYATRYKHIVGILMPLLRGINNNIV